MPKRLTPRGEAAPPVEPIVTGARIPPKETVEQAPKPKSDDSGIRYVRNLHHIEARVTLNSGRAIHLMPRGQREDVDIVNASEQEDPKFLANRGLIFEVITAEQAEKIIAKQQTNSRRRDSTVWDHLRNERGDAYEQRHATIEEAFERQGIVVAEVKETGSGRFTDKNFEVVTKPVGPEVTQVPGSPGHPATEYMQSVPSQIDPTEYHEFLLWKRFKEEMEASRDLSDAEEVRNSLNVSVEPVQTEEPAE